MSRPWFRRFGWFGVRSICWEGRLATIVAAMLLVSSAVVSPGLAHEHAIMSDLCGIAFVVIGAGFWILAHWKLERDYRR